MKRQAKNQLVLACIALAVGRSAVAQQATVQQQIPMNAHTQQETTKMNQAELEERGRKLREFLEPYFERARGKGNEPSARFSIFLEKEAEKFFPIGMSFDDATVILKTAGFQIRPRPMQTDQKYRYWLGASMDMPTSSQSLVGNITVELGANKPQLDNVHIKSSGIYVSVGANLNSF